MGWNNRKRRHDSILNIESLKRGRRDQEEGSSTKKAHIGESCLIAEREPNSRGQQIKIFKKKLDSQVEEYWIVGSGTTPKRRIQIQVGQYVIIANTM